MPKEGKKDPFFRMILDEEVYTECPIGLVDNVILQQAFEAYEFYSSGFLPEEGTIYSQTEFFVKASLMVKQKKAQMDVDAIKIPSK